VWDFVKNHSDIDASHWALEWIGFVPGKRESRRFIGQHILTEGDLLARGLSRCHRVWRLAHRHPSARGRRCAGASRRARSIICPSSTTSRCAAACPPDPRNLMFAGRNLSATHIAFASTRVMATCAVVGQGVGTAAALALRIPSAAAPRRHRIARTPDCIAG
jgi:hypothetical protein